MDENGTLELLKAQQKSRLFTAMLVKGVLAAVSTVFLMRSMPLNLATVILGAFLFALVYDVCYLYQFSLNLTRNYIIAFFVFLLLVGGGLTLYNKAVEKYGFLNGDYAPWMEYVIVFCLTLVLLLPLIFNIRSIIALSRR